MNIKETIKNAPDSAKQVITKVAKKGKNVVKDASDKAKQVITKVVAKGEEVVKDVPNKAKRFLAGAGVVAITSLTAASCSDKEDQEQPRKEDIQQDEEAKKQPTKDDHQQNEENTEQNTIASLVGNIDNDYYKPIWTPGKTSAKYVPQQYPKETEDELTKLETEIKTYIKKYEDKNKKSKTTKETDLVSVAKQVFPGFIIYTNYFGETIFYNGGPDNSGNLTQLGGNTSFSDGITIKRDNDKNQTPMKVKINTQIKYGSYKSKAYDFIRSLSFAQKMNQQGILLTNNKNEKIDNNLLIEIKSLKNRDIFINQFIQDIEILLSPFWQTTSGAQEKLDRAIENNTNKQGIIQRNAAKIFVPEKIGNNNSADIAELNRSFWTYCRYKNLLSLSDTLEMGVDYAYTLLREYVKSINCDDKKASGYVKAGILKHDGKGYAFTNDVETIKKVIEFAKKNSKKDQINKQRNTIVRQIAIDIYENYKTKDKVSPVEQFFTLQTDAGLSKYQQILFERTNIHDSKNTTEIQNFIDGINEQIPNEKDPVIRTNLKQIVLEEELHKAQIDSKDVEKAEKKLKAFFKEQKQLLDNDYTQLENIITQLSADNNYGANDEYNNAIEQCKTIIKNKTKNKKVSSNMLKTVKDLQTALENLKNKEYNNVENIYNKYIDNGFPKYIEAVFLYIAGIVRDAQVSTKPNEDEIIKQYKKANNNFVAASDKMTTENYYKKAKDESEKRLKTITTYVNKTKEIKGKIDKTPDSKNKDKAKLYYDAGQTREELAQFFQDQKKLSAAKEQLTRTIKNYDEAIKFDSDNEQYKKAKSDAEKNLKNLKDKLANKENKQISFNNAKRSIDGILASKRQLNHKTAQVLKQNKYK